MSINIRTDFMQHAELFGNPVLFTNWLIQRDTIPKDWYCYDLRGTRQSPNVKIALVDKTARYHAGTVLSPTPLKRKETASRRVNSAFHLLGEEMTLEQFCEEHSLEYPQDDRKFAIKAASFDEAALFYAMTPEEDQRLGCIGHVRMDFGHRGQEFWHTWWPRGPEELNSPEFKAELQEVVDELRTSVLKDLAGMTKYCWGHGGEVGGWPANYDKTVLAIQDGELTEFWARYPKALDQADSLLVETAGRPGAVGRRMTLSILSAATKISPSAYLTACKRAVDTGDGQRVQSLIEQAESCLSEPLPALTGVAILHAYTNGHRNMAKDLIAQCTSEQIAAAPPNLLRRVAERLDFQTAMELVDKGVQPGDYAADVLHTLTGQHQEWMAEKLLEHGMPVAADNYAALYVCVNNQAAGVAKLLLDRGMDLEQYQTWAEKQRKNEGYEETMAELTEYWSELQSGPEQDSPSMDGMSL